MRSIDLPVQCRTLLNPQSFIFRFFWTEVFREKEIKLILLKLQLLWHQCENIHVHSVGPADTENLKMKYFAFFSRFIGTPDKMCR